MSKAIVRPQVPKASRITAEHGRKRALVICNSTYACRDEVLLGAKMDFKLMSQALSDPGLGGFEVTGLMDKGFLEARTAIARLCRESTEDDTLLIHYSGSSYQGDDGNFYLPVSDSDREYPDATALDAEFILRCLRESTCRRIILLIDGCHSGGFFANNRGIPDGLYAITACAADETTFETPDGGFFTRALVDGMQLASTDVDGDGYISIDELHAFVRKRLTSMKVAAHPKKWVWNVQDQIHIAKAPARVFLSYCREDVKVATELKAAMESMGLSIWLDLEGITSGDFEDRVTTGLDKARALVLLLTKASMASGAVKKEVDYAEEMKVPIIPVSIGPLAKSDLPKWYIFGYQKIHRHELKRPITEAGIEGLLQAIRDCRR